MFNREKMEKSFAATDKVFESYWQMHRLSFENFTFLQKKSEEMFNKSLEEAKKIGAEQTDYMNIMLTQSKKGQEQVKNMFQETMRIGQENLQAGLKKDAFNLFKKQASDGENN